MLALNEIVDPWVHVISKGVEIAGVVVMLAGGFVASVAFVHGSLFVGGWPESFERFRANLGRSILLGLELLVAADIIRTIAIAPNFENLGVLALIVAIRTFLSFSIEVEIEGRWPWRRQEGAKSPHAPAPPAAQNRGARDADG
jgi:uncharacterized membrane protein